MLSGMELRVRDSLILLSTCKDDHESGRQTNTSYKLDRHCVDDNQRTCLSDQSLIASGGLRNSRPNKKGGSHLPIVHMMSVSSTRRLLLADFRSDIEIHCRRDSLAEPCFLEPEEDTKADCVEHVDCKACTLTQEDE